MAKRRKRSQKQKNYRLLIALAALVLFAVIMRLRIPTYHSIPKKLGANAEVEVIAAYPHNPESFTQGLLYADGVLYESAGLYGQSALRKLELETGVALLEKRLEEQYFAEGLTLLDGRLYQLTWKENKGFIYNPADFSLEGTFTYGMEGWGLTTDGSSLILSDGSAVLYFIDPKTMQTTRTLQVTLDGAPLEKLNELEYIRGEIYANIWYKDIIVRINPQTGQVIGEIDCSILRQGENSLLPKDVLNGIAYDAEGDRLFITGKNWPRIYEVVLKNAKNP
ncbi:MAG TPA: glutaminyl-peptide cyclotransferase [Anaerolineaceae bacterium]|nr:glutaminyl-peptide cyclotransferase [Anaerolineaceae bacterium]HOE35626.1 glutaminyl-peptide cyclotransferase [Anaerolineaceae bacterium]HOT26226.1 glutaminyl-peptide cyclotransferase [Anaerolineaceae bacterium]HQH58311.1 glutaminyl-peptide cyclotransferase [Anaerolineaceae bacterium]HQK03956.1 glutaminyl-peptide cyclotransferase [Anaerolineaceae bacterium]